MAREYTLKFKQDNNSKKIKCVNFNGLSDHYYYIKEHIDNNTFGIREEVAELGEWGGKYTLDESLEAMFYGFESVTNYFMDYITDIRSQDTIGDGMAMGVEGSMFDMGSVIEGIPECCIVDEMPSQKQCIPIIIDISFSCIMEAQQIYNRGIAITNLINTLLIYGYIVDLKAMMYNHQHDMDIMTTLNVDTNNLSIANIAYISTTDYFRKIGFATMDCVRQRSSELGRGNSTVLPFMLNKFKEDKIFYIGGDYGNNEMRKKLSTVDSANKYILKLFNLYCKENKIKISFREDFEKENVIKCY